LCSFCNGTRARKAAAEDMMASTWLSIAVGAGEGAVKGWTLTSGGRVGSTVSTQFLVIEEVALGLMRRMLTAEGAIVSKSLG
jgi:hypothetical protein